MELYLPDASRFARRAHEGQRRRIRRLWFKNKVYKPGTIPQSDADAYVRAYAQEGRMDAPFDYWRKIVDDMEFKRQMILVAVTGWAIMVLWEIAALPLTLPLVRALKRHEGVDYFDVGTDFNPLHF